MSKKGEFEVEFIRLTHPQTGRAMGCIGIDTGDHVYLPATLHPSVIAQSDAGRAAFIKCHKAKVPVAAFENAFYVEAKWLREELQVPFSQTVGSRTLTNSMLDMVAKSMMDAASAFQSHRKNGKVAGKGDASADAVLLEVAVDSGAAA